MAKKIAQTDVVDVSTVDGLNPHSVLEYYVASSVKSSIDAFEESVKKSFKQVASEQGDGGRVLTDTSGLTVKVSKVAGKKTFNSQKALEALKGKLSGPDFEAQFASFAIRKKPKTTIPKNVLNLLDKYFDVEKSYAVTEADLWKYFGEQEISNFYEAGEGYLKVTKPSKVSSKELRQMYQDAELDTLIRLIES